MDTLLMCPLSKRLADIFPGLRFFIILQLLLDQENIRFVAQISFNSNDMYKWRNIQKTDIFLETKITNMCLLLGARAAKWCIIPNLIGRTKIKWKSGSNICCGNFKRCWRLNLFLFCFQLAHQPLQLDAQLNRLGIGGWHPKDQVPTKMKSWPVFLDSLQPPPSLLPLPAATFTARLPPVSAPAWLHLPTSRGFLLPTSIRLPMWY